MKDCIRSAKTRMQEYNKTIGIDKNRPVLLLSVLFLEISARGGIYMSRRLMIVFTVIFCLHAGIAFSAEKKANGLKKALVDRKPPVVNISSSVAPSNGGLINNSKPVVSAEFIDDGIGVSTNDTKLYVDGQDVSASAQVSPNKIIYNPSAPLADGGHKIKLYVVDKAGNASEVQWSFAIHTQPPQIKITSHQANQFVNKSPVVIFGSINDPRARIVVNGISAFVEKNVFSAKVSLVEGNNTITAVATDGFGNTGSDAVVIVVDTKPPIVDITSPTASSLINTRLVTVTGITDKNAASVTVGSRAGAQGVSAILNAGTFTAKDVKLEEGMNTITVTALSQAGNKGTASVKVLVDSIPPKLTITTPRDMTVMNKKMITVSGTVDKSSAMVKVNDTPVQVSKGKFTLSSLSLSEGNNTITATAVDRAGNQAKASVVTIVLDTTPPAPPTLAPLPPVTRMSPVTVSGNTEPGARVDVFANSAPHGTIRADEKGAFSLKINLVEGNNAVSAVSYDAPGNASAPSAVVNVFLDTKPPKIL